MELSKPIPTELNKTALGSGLLSDLMLWLVIPISPLRYQPPKSAVGADPPIRAAARRRSAQVGRPPGQEHREQPDRRQEGADLIGESDAGVIGEPAEHGCAKATDAERDTEEHP